MEVDFVEGQPLETDTMDGDNGTMYLGVQGRKFKKNEANENKTRV